MNFVSEKVVSCQYQCILIVCITLCQYMEHYLKVTRLSIHLIWSNGASKSAFEFDILDINMKNVQFMDCHWWCAASNYELIENGKQPRCRSKNDCGSIDSPATGSEHSSSILFVILCECWTIKFLFVWWLIAKIFSFPTFYGLIWL